MDSKRYQRAFENNIPDGYRTDTYIIACPVCHKEFQTAEGTAICPACGSELEFTVSTEEALAPDDAGQETAQA